MEEYTEQIVQLLAQSNDNEQKGELRTAIAYAQQAFAQAQAANAVSCIAAVQTQLARLHARTGEYAQARSHAAQVLAAQSASQPATALAVDARITLGICCAETDDCDGAEEHFQQAVAQSRAINDGNLLGRALHNLASTVYVPRGQFDLALAVMQEAQHFHSQTGKRHWGMPFLQALIYELTGNTRHARQALDELLPLLQPANRVTGGYFYLWARLAIGEGEFERAREYLHLLMRSATATGAPDLNIWARIESARMHRLQGNPAVGRTWAEDGVKFARRIGYQHLAGQALLELSLCERAVDDRPAALAHLAVARALFDRYSAMFDLACVLFLEAAWAWEDGSPGAEMAWQHAAAAIQQGGYAFLLEREREIAFPLIAAYARSRDAAARKAAETMLAGLERVSPPPLRVHGLGGFVVWQSRRQIADGIWQRRKAGELFRFLMLQNGFTAHRDAILEALWPEHDPEAALEMLHQSTSTLRRILEPDLPDKFPSRYLVVEGERIILRLPLGSRVDFLEFEQQVNASMSPARPDRLQEALKAYSGELFPMDRYSDWSAAHRERLSLLYQRGMQILGQALLAGCQYLGAIDCCKAVLALDPWNEDAVLVGMQAYLRMRDAPHAVRLFQRLEATLREDLALAPRSDLRALAAAAREESVEMGVRE